jgi:hypothetical protein
MGDRGATVVVGTSVSTTQGHDGCAALVGNQPGH